jgi:hypothetical protein
VKEKFRKLGETVRSPASTFTQIRGQFSNTGTDPTMAEAQLFYQDQFWGKLGPSDPVLSANTYEGHVWNIMVDGRVVKTWRIAEKDGKEQTFSI